VYAVKVRCLHALADIATLRTKINALNLVSTRPDPFATFEFYENLLRYPDSLTGGTRSGVWFLVAFIERDLIGYLALEEVTVNGFWRRGKRLGFLVAHSADRPHVVARAEHLGIATEMFYEYLAEHRRDWDFLELQQQDAASTLYPLPPGVQLPGCWVRSWPNLANGTIRVRWNTLQEYFDALAPRMRANLKRQTRKLLASGNVELLTSADPVSTPALLALYCSIERRSWKTPDLTVSGTAQRLDYYRALLGARQPMRVVIQVLLLDGVPIAGLISGSFAGPASKGLYALHMVFDEHLRTAAPGSVIFMLGMRYAIDGRFAFLNLLSGFGYYKTRWLADMTATRAVQIYRFGSLFFWRRLLGDTRRWLQARVPASARWLLTGHRTVEIGEPDEDHPSPAHVQPAALVTTAERAAFATWLAEARRGQCEQLSAQELTAALPLHTKLRSSGKAAKQGSRPARPAAAAPCATAATTKRRCPSG